MQGYDSVSTGTLLITHPGLTEPTFHHSVILILDHGAQGTQGIILNKPSEHLIAHSVRQIASGWQPQEQLFIGGPVLGHCAFMLHTPEWRTEDTVDVSEDLALTVGTSAIPLMRDTYQPCHWRLFVGNSAWAPNQLEMEFERGRHWPQYGWLTAEYPGAEWIFDQDPGVLYTSAISLSTQQTVNHWF